MEQSVVKNVGDLLKLMGDGRLTVFPSSHDKLAAAGMKLRAVYHVGEIHYGNIVVRTRLDSTTIGPAVNIGLGLLAEASQQGA